MASDNPSVDRLEEHEQESLYSAIRFQGISLILAVIILALLFYFFGQSSLFSIPSSVEGLPIVAFFILGLAVGMSQCIWKAFPYLIPVISIDVKDSLDNPNSMNQQAVLLASLAFSLGRLLVYLLYSISILVLGSVFLAFVMDPEDSKLLLGMSYGLAGLIAFLYATRRLIHLSHGSCTDECLTTNKYSRYEAPFALGAMSSLVPCFPMMLVLWISFWGFISSDNFLIPILVPMAFGLGSLIPISAIAIAIFSGRDMLALGIGPRGIKAFQILSVVITLSVSIFLMASFWLFIIN
ncbi:MAG: sulfite exporter TauE/SafE family protein [Candidatus Heimdallarchaeota archaeon]